MPRPWLGALLLVIVLTAVAPAVRAESANTDLMPRLQEIYTRRSQALLTGQPAALIEPDYFPGSRTAEWALLHERGKLRYMQRWAQNRGVQIVAAEPVITVKYLSGNPERARFYVAQSLALGYVYPDDPAAVNRFGVGTRHIIELRRKDGQWLVALEWYTDPLGDDTEVPDVTPAAIPQPLPRDPHSIGPVLPPKPSRGYNREGAVAYADKYCGLAWGCGNQQRYNPRYRDYNGVGGDCTNYVSQALREGGGLNIGLHTRVDGLAGTLQYSGLGSVQHKAPFQELWKRAAQQPEGFHSMLQLGDLIAYQEKGKLEHFGIVTGFDSRGYPLINSHTADRYHVPFDLGWDRKTVYWLFRMR